MFRRSLLAMLAIAGLLTALASPVSADTLPRRVQRDWQRAQKTPMLKRPNRFGHIYGNNVRRLYHGRLFINAEKHPQPVERYFYLVD